MTDMARERSAVAVLLVPLVRGWRAVLVVLLVVWAVVLTVGLVRGHQWRAQAALSTVSSSRALPVTGLGGGLAASLLGAGGTGGGVQLTPGFVVQLARMEGVLYNVGVRPSPVGEGRVVDRLARKAPGEQVGTNDVVKTMREHLTAQFDNQTGVITLRVAHQDSALARAVLQQLIDAVSATFREASRSQARQIRLAQQRRVDSAEERLREAEQRLREFVDRNRVVTQYSPEYVRRQEIERDVATADAMYTQALADRDAAAAKELEETPAVVVIDPPPPELPREPRGLAIRLVLVTIVVVALMWVLLVVRDGVQRAVRDPGPAERELLDAVAAVPGGRLVLRLVVGRDPQRHLPA